MTGRLLTARQVADQLGVSAETVLRWTRRGELPAIRLPSGAIRYREIDVDDWLCLREVGAATEEAPTTPGRARARAYNGLSSLVPTTPPPDAAPTEEGT